jgi:hypothetical protein
MTCAMEIAWHRVSVTSSKSSPLFFGEGAFIQQGRGTAPPPLPRPPTNKLPTEKTTREVWLLGHGLHAQGVPVEDVHREFVRYELRRLVGGVVKNS